MEDNFFDFILSTTKENFLKAQERITKSEGYDPYSQDIEIITDLLDNNKYKEASSYTNLNILLSPRAHLLKQYAFTQLGNDNEAKAEMILAQKILEGLSLTGDGTKELPYLVTRISDERDLLDYLNEKFSAQSLIQENNRAYDRITTASAKQIYFDITAPYLRMQKLMNEGSFDLDKLFEESGTKSKKWWQFWK